MQVSKRYRYDTGPGTDKYQEVREDTQTAHSFLAETVNGHRVFYFFISEVSSYCMDLGHAVDQEKKCHCSVCRADGSWRLSSLLSDPDGRLVNNANQCV